MAIDFDGVNDRINMPQNASLKPTSVTVSMWAESRSAFDTATALVWESGSRSRYHIIIDGAGTNTVRFRIRLSAPDETIFKVIDISNTWTHIAGTYNETSGDQKLYINGVEEVSATPGPGAITDNGFGEQRLIIGDDPDQSPWAGIADDIRVYDRELSAAEIATIFATRGTDGIVKGLVGRWIMNEGAPGTTASGANTVKDLSSSDNDSEPLNGTIYRAGELRFRRKVS